MKIGIFIQARSKSKRLPGKIYKTIGDKSILEWCYSACKEAETMIGSKAMTAIIGPSQDKELEAFCTSYLMNSYYPECEEEDVHKRYILAAEHFDCTHVIRITSDCWCPAPNVIKTAADRLEEDDYISNTGFRTFPEGLDTQASSLKVLKWLYKKDDKEHLFMRLDSNSTFRQEYKAAGFTYGQIMNPQLSFLLKGFSIDSEEDLEAMRKVYSHQLNKNAKA